MSSGETFGYNYIIVQLTFILFVTCMKKKKVQDSFALDEGTRK